MTHRLQSTLEASGIEWPALRNHIPCMAHVIQLAVGVFMTSLGVKGCTMSWEAHECDQHCGENESVDIGKCQRIRKEGNARIDRVSAMKPGLANMIEKVHISRYFESAEIDLHIAQNSCCIDYANTWSSKQVYWLSKSKYHHRGNSDNGSQDPLEPDPRVAPAHLPITWIHTHVSYKPKIQRLLATLRYPRWMDHCEVCHRSVEAIPILDPVDVEESYSHTASRYLSLQWSVWSHGWRNACCG